MLDTRPLLLDSDFPPLQRGPVTALQVNMGYRCNLSCTHCHVNAGPTRTEMMDAETVALVLEYCLRHRIKTLDLTGGAPELNPEFQDLVMAARLMGIQVIDRCNLTVLLEPGQEDLTRFLADHGVTIVASLPCYLEENVDGQRGKGTYQGSIEALKRLNALGYGRPESGLKLDLVYNPTGPFLPPPQQALEADYKRELDARFGIVFNQLLTIANMPISRFGSVLLSKGTFHDYLRLLRDSHRPDNLAGVMCRSLLSIEWQGRVYDCDFNQMLDLPLIASDKPRPHLRDLLNTDLNGGDIVVAAHCYGCTAGQGSSRGGAVTPVSSQPSASL